MAKEPKPLLTAAALEALGAAADEFFEEGYAWTVHAKTFRDTLPQLRQQAMDKLLPKRKSCDGFYLWLQHIAWIESIREFAPQLELTAQEVQGLAVFSLARNRFQRSHPPCLYCGMPNDASEMTCYSCFKEINR